MVSATYFISKRIKNKNNDIEFDNDLVCFLVNGGHRVAVDIGAGCGSQTVLVDIQHCPSVHYRVPEEQNKHCLL